MPDNYEQDECGELDPDKSEQKRSVFEMNSDNDEHTAPSSRKRLVICVGFVSLIVILIGGVLGFTIPRGYPPENGSTFKGEACKDKCINKELNYNKQRYNFCKTESDKEDYRNYGSHCLPFGEQDQRYVLITGDHKSEMEIMNENSEDWTIPIKTDVCSRNSQYPLKVQNATAGLVSGKIIICGGSYNPTLSDGDCFGPAKAFLKGCEGPFLSSKECFIYGENKNWTKLADMSTVRSQSSSVSIPDGALLVTGGQNGVKVLKSSEMVFTNGSVIPGKSLPEPRYGHCLVQYKNIIISSGGHDGKNSTSTVWLFDSEIDSR